MCRDRRPPGYSLVELIVALVVLALLGTACLGILTVELRLVRAAASGAEAGNATRFASRLLRSELRPLIASRDLRGLGPDSVSQRVFRGIATVCTAGPTADVRFRGIRDPDPAKDSLLILSSAGEDVVALASVGAPVPPTCAPEPGETLLRLSAARPLLLDEVLLVFESGTWHLSSSALRYERGAGGRQPVTAGVFEDDSTELVTEYIAGGLAAIRLKIAARAAGGPAHHGLLLELQRIALLNLRLPLDSAVLPP